MYNNYMAVMKLVYCASPARLSDRKDEIMEFVISKGKAPLHPFNALPVEYFETDKITRADTLNLCCRLVDFCDEFWLFGISEGTLTEAEYFLAQRHDKTKGLKVLVDTFDPEYLEYANTYRQRFSKTLTKLGL